jgi:hypothetical protein
MYKKSDHSSIRNKESRVYFIFIERAGSYLQLIFFRLNASEAAPNTDTSVAPALSASSKPYWRGASNGSISTFVKQRA